MTDTEDPNPEDPNPADFDFENRRSSSGPTTYSSGPLVYNPIALVSLVSGILSLTGMFMGGIFTIPFATRSQSWQSSQAALDFTMLIKEAVEKAWQRRA